MSVRDSDFEEVGIPMTSSRICCWLDEVALQFALSRAETCRRVLDTMRWLLVGVYFASPLCDLVYAKYVCAKTYALSLDHLLVRYRETLRGYQLRLEDERGAIF